MDVRVIDSEGKGRTSTLIQALDWIRGNARRLGIRVVNLSLGHPPFESYRDDPLGRAVGGLIDDGLVVVASAGNLGKTEEFPVIWGAISSPANHPGVIAVSPLNTLGTVTHLDDVATSYGSRGPAFVDGHFKPDITAPGNRIPSLLVEGSTLAEMLPERITDPGVFEMSGASMAVPFVSGTVAIMLQANPELGPGLVKSILKLSAVKLEQPHMLEQGNGLVNTRTAVELALALGLEAGGWGLAQERGEGGLQPPASRPQPVPVSPELAPTRNIKPIVFDPTIQARTGALDLKAVVADFLPVHPNNRWIVVSWLLTAFFLGLVRQRAVLRLTGERCSGKTTAAHLLACLLYGTGSVKTGGSDAEWNLKAGNPLLVIDPARNGCGDLDRLLLGLAQGTERRPALAIVTGSEAFKLKELADWTFQVECSREFHDNHLVGLEHLVDVLRFRSRILSGIFQLLAHDVVPGLDHRRALVLQKIRQQHASHSKSHLDSFLALMTVILQALLGTLHGSGSRGEYEAWRLMSGFIEEQQ